MTAWLATMVMVLPIVALVVPNLVRGAEPTIDVPDRVSVGSALLVRGADFSPRMRGEIAIADVAAAFEVGSDGQFTIRLELPETTSPGRHEVRAFEVDEDGARSREVASATIRIEPLRPRSILSRATPSPTPDASDDLRTAPPRATIAVRPSATPTAVPTAQPVETAANQPANTAAPRATSAPKAAPNTPAPVAPPPVQPGGKGAGRVFVIAPNGSNSGAGTVASPWQTYGHASKFLKPGDTLYARGGVYAGQGGYAWSPTASGTPGAPIWFAAYPGEVPVFDGGDRQEQFLIFHDQVHNVIVDGLRVQNYHPVQNGILLLIGSAHDIVLQNLVMAGNHGTSATPIEHLIYPGASPYNITIRNNVLDAAGISGAAIHMYHDPGPRNVVIEGNVIRNGHWGVIVASNANGVTIRGNAFAGNRRANIEVWDVASNVVVSGNSPNDGVLR